ncbi:hypothetical protein [Nocardia sp. NPDC052566]|uniref:hypothetical protein n=1 Tax=Nocardia sp. NPDC052566 TaxID=3364330 RepID=UPI0037C55A5C
MGGESDAWWEGFKTRTHGSGGTISVPHDLAKKAAQTLGEAEGTLAAIADRSNWLAFDPRSFGTLPAPVGGNNLGNEFRAQGDKLPALLAKHQGRVRSMRETFVLADARYKSSEAHSANWFQRLEPAPKSVGDGLLTSGGSDGPRSDVPDIAGVPFTLGRRGESLSLKLSRDQISPNEIDYVDGAALWWGDLYRLGQTIDAGSVYKAAENWLWLHSEVDKLRHELLPLSWTVFEGWTGVGERSGAKAAESAFGRYKEDLEAVADSMWVMGFQLATAAGWLAATVPLMPQTPLPPVGFESAVFQARANYNAHYLAGFLATKVPVLSEGAR